MRPPSTRKSPDLIERESKKKEIPPVTQQEKLILELQETEKSLKNFMKILKNNIKEQREASDSRAPSGLRGDGGPSAIRPPKK